MKPYLKYVAKRPLRIFFPLYNPRFCKISPQATKHGLAVEQLLFVLSNGQMYYFCPKKIIPQPWNQIEKGPKQIAIA